MIRKANRVCGKVRDGCVSVWRKPIGQVGGRVGKVVPHGVHHVCFCVELSYLPCSIRAPSYSFVDRRWVVFSKHEWARPGLRSRAWKTQLPEQSRAASKPKPLRSWHAKILGCLGFRLRLARPWCVWHLTHHGHQTTSLRCCKRLHPPSHANPNSPQRSERCPHRCGHPLSWGTSLPQLGTRCCRATIGSRRKTCCTHW